MHLHFDCIHDHLFLTVKRKGSFIFPFDLIPCTELSQIAQMTRLIEVQNHGPIVGKETVSEESNRGCAVYFKALQVC